MGNFNLENYETVKERKKRFYDDYPDGSLITELVYHEQGHCIMKGFVYRNKEELEKKLPHGVSHAEEYQGEGGFANKYSWMENCDESAIGRALDNAGYSGNNKCSREEIQKIERKEKLNKTKKEAQEFFNQFPEHVKQYTNEFCITDKAKYDFCAQHGWSMPDIDVYITKIMGDMP